MPQSPHAPFPAAPASSQRQLLKWVMTAGGLLAFTLLGLLVLLYAGLSVGPVGLIIGAMMAILPVPVYVSLALWLDRYEAEPPYLLALSFIWGATAAVIFALIFQLMGAVAVGLLAGENAAEVFGKVIAAPITEEIGKGLALLLLYWWKRDEFDGIVDGVIYATMVALGFAMAENVVYYGDSQSVGEAVGTFTLRGILMPFLHPLFTSMTGIGLGWARQSDRGAVKILAPVTGLVLAILLHAIWNGSTLLGALFILVYILIFLPLLLGALVLVFLSLRREGRIVREYLAREAQLGALGADSYGHLCSVRGRMRLSLVAFQRGGLRGWLSQREFHQVASELAFHRHRVARRVVPVSEKTAAEEAAYLHRLSTVLARLREYHQR